VATSSKVMWKLETLTEQALAAIDERIAAKVLEVEAYANADISADMKRWRADQEARVSDLFRQLDTIDDVALSRFRIDKMPSRDEYAKDRAERDLKGLQNRRARIVAKAASLVADEDGNIALTKTQLAEFFDL
jgi:hypothetical protein